MKGNYLKHKEDILLDLARFYFKTKYGLSTIIINFCANFGIVIYDSIKQGIIDWAGLESSFGRFLVYLAIIGILLLIYICIKTIFFNFEQLEKMHEPCKTVKIKKLEK